jgi:hypothetical protein
MQESSSNPYRPPQAEVDDFLQPDAEPGPKPQQVFIAVALLWVMLLVQVAGLAWSWRFYRLLPMFAIISLSLVTIFWILTAGLVAMIERGRNWARYTYLVLYLLGLPFFVIMMFDDVWRAPVFAVSQLVQAALQTIALVFLFLRPSREWFRGP